MQTETAELDQLQNAFKEAVEAWITTIRQEEALASTEHSVADIDQWESAADLQQRAGKKVRPQSVFTRTHCGRSSSASRASTFAAARTPVVASGVDDVRAILAVLQ